MCHDESLHSRVGSPVAFAVPPVPGSRLQNAIARYSNTVNMHGIVMSQHEGLHRIPRDAAPLAPSELGVFMGWEVHAAGAWVIAA